MINSKNKFYDKYFSTHISHRKGEASLEEFRQRSISYQKQFGGFLPKNNKAKLIDLGCGNGSVTWWLQNIGFTNAIGIDISAEQVEIVNRLGVKNIQQADIKTYLSEKKDFYDVIFARDIIEHFNKEDLVDVLSLCYNSLKNNGILVIQAPNAESPFFGRIRYGDFTHEIAFTTSSLSQLLRIIGFLEIQFYPKGPLVNSVGSFVRVILWKFVEVFYKFLIFVEIGRVKAIVTQDIIAVGKK